MMNRQRRDTLSEPLQASIAGSVVRRGRILAMASLLVVAPMITGFPQISSPPRAHPVKSHVRQVSFVPSSVAALRVASNATPTVSAPGAQDPITTARAAAVTPVQDVAGAVTVVGVIWPKAATAARAKYQIRTLTNTTWSRWQSLGVIDGGPDSTGAASTTTGTDPYVITGASKYEVRSLTTDASVPTAATVEAINPGTSSADDVQQAPGAATAATIKPTIYTRAQWGANESLMTWTPSYGNIQVGFVHHTVDTNDYTADQVPAMIRGIYAYHAQTLGWGDIGYNFLIDRFGRTWEGRSGGMDKPVIGGQTYGFNSVSTGVAAIGNFDIAPAPQAMTDAFKQIFAWKFSLAGIPATGASPVLAPNGTPLQRVSGHRDAYATACPGQYLYANLPEIREGTAAIMNAPAALPFARLAGADRYDTAVAIAQSAFQLQSPGQPFAVTVASGTNFPDALAAGPVAAASGGPLLLVPSDGVLPATVSAELTRLTPSSMNIAGGIAAVSSHVESQLKGFGIGTVIRLAGQDRYDTAAQLAGITNGGLGKTVFIATGASFPDALGGSAAAGRLGGALLLTDRFALPAATASALTSGKPVKVVILGGDAVIDPKVLLQVQTLLPGTPVEQWAGSDRYATAAAISSNTYPLGATTAYLASEANYPDALAGAPVAALAGAPLLLTERDCVPASTLAELTRLGTTNIVVLGGTSAVSDAAANLTPCTG
jgi:putative cell wall-binding protein